MIIREVDESWQIWLQDMQMQDRLRDFSFILGFLIVFRSQKAYSRWWEGGTLLQQLRGEWFNAFSSLLAFCNTDPKIREEVEHFQKYLACMISLLYASALKQVSAMEDTKFELIGIEGFDMDSMEFMVEAHDSCEVVLQWVQRLIVEANGKDIIKIAPPILSRVYNQLGNGIVKLNNARKIKQFPIPFPLAQMVAFMLVCHTVVTAGVVAFSVGSIAVGPFLTFAVVTAFWCIYYISVELEQPYGDDPNDLPLHDMMCDLNNSLLGILHPIAGSPPEYDWKRSKDDGAPLSRHKIDLVTYVATLKDSGGMKRRTLRASTIRCSAVGPEGRQEDTVFSRAGRSSVVLKQEDEEKCDSGTATEGSCDDKMYTDGQGAKSSLRASSAPSSPPPGTLGQAAEAKSSASLEQVRPENGVTAAEETKATQAFRPIGSDRAGDCLPCQSIAGMKAEDQEGNGSRMKSAEYITQHVAGE
eukprot:CAMPEP_0197640054 /NCGR_PEP_ID=MMETSP1338-20131121/14475_1 /TAXON_ID=43686 ORGANISM="Pelagodinium beii, Strain RCC1491" /NCGR_SAMPLE_ID=MMETSP1338 /ASSEMBLY_ACC=CAM_ASM_000754 /LENGTH=470 /DNA_ID=CAMNT_0043212859 /DNA_START=95 /DNA_END=1508 /DNA_ORIENTATION=+